MKNKNICKSSATIKVIFISLTLFWAFLLVFNAFGVPLKNAESVNADSLSIRKEIAGLRPKLNYPNLVDRFYQERLYKNAWVRQDTVKSDVWM